MPCRVGGLRSRAGWNTFKIVVLARIRLPTWVAARLALLALAAWFAAEAVSSFVAASLLGDPVERVAAPALQTAARHRPPLAEYLQVARRDLFAGVPTQADAPITANGPLAAAPADLRLLGTGGRDEQNFAVIEIRSSREQRVVQLGDDLDGAKVTEIGWRRVVLRRDGTDELLTVPADLAVELGGPATTGWAVPNLGGGAAAGDSEVQRLGEDRFQLSRGEVDKQLGNLSSLLTQMRAVPNLKDGATNGFRLFAIRRGSLFDKLGLTNNDVVQRVNGIGLDDPARAMGLFQELQDESVLSVDVLRGGRPRTLRYEIR